MITNFYYSIKTKDVNNSAAYFGQLGFSQKGISDGKKILMTEGSFLLELNEEGFTGLILFEDDITPILEKLTTTGIPYQPVIFNDKRSGYLFCDLSGMQVLLFNTVKGDDLEVENTPHATCGKFYEISVKCNDVKKNIEFWKSIGFNLDAIYEKGAMWASMTYKNLHLGIYSPEACNHYFEGPTLTFFDSDMENIIKNLQQKGFVFHQLLPNPENKITDAVAVSPEGQALFMFYANF